MQKYWTISLGIGLAWTVITCLLAVWSKVFSFHPFQHQMSDQEMGKLKYAKNCIFLQVSDLHINRFHPQEGLNKFKEFVSEILPLVQPDFVLVTGDITDAKSKHGFSSGQHLEEWKLYADITKDRRNWFDLRGNHDAFDVAIPEGDYFKEFSVQKKYAYSRRLPELGVTVVAIDGSPSYGLPRPYNFFGSLDVSKMDHLERHLREAEGTDIIMIGHYPTVTMQFALSSSGQSFAQLTRQAAAYLSGHLHRLFFGLGQEIKRVQPNGLRDFELIDLKDHGYFRIGVIHEGSLSFHDFTLTDEVLICILSPIDGHQGIFNGNQVKVLVFGRNHQVSSVKISGQTELVAQEGLFVGTLPRNPKEISIEVTTADGRKWNKTQQISSTDRIPFGSFGEWFLGFPLPRVIILFLTAVYGVLLLLVLSSLAIVAWKDDRDMTWMVKLHQTVVLKDGPWWKIVWLHYLKFGRRTSMASQVSLAIALMAIAPWFWGPLCSGSSYGFVFLYGVLHSAGSWDIILDTWFYAAIHLGLFVYPAVALIILYSNDTNLSAEPKSPPAIQTELPWYHSVCFYAIIGCWAGFNLLRVGIMMANYGWFAFLSSPVYTWTTLWFLSALIFSITQSRAQQQYAPLKVA